MSGPALVDIPLESRDRYSATKKLITAVSIESPDLFRIHGVPCIDRGPDKLRPPAAYEHWRDDGSTSVEDIARVATGAAVQPVKKTANFARPSSVSADTPNFFKIPGVAINSSSAITGVEAVCSPPPKHRPFSLPGTYMHGRESKTAVDRRVLPGRWRETDREVGQWGHATRQFHESLMEMRRESAAREKYDKKGAPSQNERSCDTDSSARSSRSVRHEKTKGEEARTPSSRQPSRPGDSPAARPHRHSSTGGGAAAEVCSTRSSPHRHAGPGATRSAGKSAGLDKEGPARGGRGGVQQEESRNVRGEDADRTRRRASAVEVFMSRLEGERGPQNRRESIQAFRHMLGDCQTNNSAQFRDDAVKPAGGGGYGGGGGGTRGPSAQDSTDASHAAMGTAAALRDVLLRRKVAHDTVAGLMSTDKGSYMLGPGADASKVSLGRDRMLREAPTNRFYC